MHDAAEHLALGEFGGRDARRNARQGVKPLSFIERAENFLGGVAVKAAAVGETDEFAEDDEVDIRVNEGGAGGVAELSSQGGGRLRRSRTTRA